MSITGSGDIPRPRPLLVAVLAERFEAALVPLMFEADRPLDERALVVRRPVDFAVVVVAIWCLLARFDSRTSPCSARACNACRRRLAGRLAMP
ncbi:MAG TPA: hypothetical protein VFI28_04710 [Candidatus Limnocylindrales bacterium]|nr:hypothetical protein [Candidatus Limnocylindrales bacterium]